MLLCTIQLENFHSRVKVTNITNPWHKTLKPFRYKYDQYLAINYVYTYQKLVLFSFNVCSNNCLMQCLTFYKQFQW